MIIGNPAKIRVSVIPLGIPGIRVVKPEEPKIGKKRETRLKKRSWRASLSEGPPRTATGAMAKAAAANTKGHPKPWRLFISEGQNIGQLLRVFR
jgi:hypothetical protein